jgi:hypothetical protein
MMETDGDKPGIGENRARREERKPDTVSKLGPSLITTPGGEGKSRLGGELGREDQRFSRTVECVDMDKTVDDMREGFLRLPFSPNFG